MSKGLDHRDPSAPSISGLALTIIMAAVVIGSLRPFSEICPWSQLPGRLLLLLKPTSDSFAASELAQRLISFVPIGILLRWRYIDRAAHRSRARACFVTIAMVCILEFAQCFVPSRHPRLFDALIAAAAGIAGAGLGATLHPIQVGARRYYHKHVGAILATALLASLAIVTAVIIAGHVGARIEGWSSEYPLIVANELTEDRPWRGQIRGFAIYASELSPADVARVSKTTFDASQVDMRRQLGAISLYSFENVQGGIVRDQITGKNELDLMLPEPGPQSWLPADRGIEIKGPVLIRGVSDAGQLSEVISGTSALSVETEVYIADTSLSGPARIVSISKDATERNLTLGQQFGNIEFRVRTPRGGPNGSRVRCRTTSNPLTVGWHHLAASFGNGVLRIYTDGAQVRAPLHLYWPNALLLRGDGPANSSLAAAILFMPLGYLAVSLRPRRGASYVLAIAALVVSLSPLAISTILTMLLDREHDQVFIVAALLASIAGAAIARSKTSRLSNNPLPSIENIEYDSDPADLPRCDSR